MKNQGNPGFQVSDFLLAIAMLVVQSLWKKFKKKNLSAGAIRAAGVWTD